MLAQLKAMGIKRDPKVGIGKKMGKDIWFHKSYVLDILDKTTYQKYKRLVPDDFQFEIIRWNESKSELAFIECNDFDIAHEPIVGNVLKVQFIDENPMVKLTKAPSDPLIYHHKWLFVKDDYTNFNVFESQVRSLTWKTILGVNKEISSRIGRLSFWDKWLKENNLEGRVNDK